jgi:hypothetical protein
MPDFSIGSCLAFIDLRWETISLNGFCMLSRQDIWSFVPWI